MPQNNRRAGALRERLEFQKKVAGDDGWSGEAPEEFQTQFTIAASLTPRTGGEEVTAARLSGRQPYVCTVRQSSLTRQITTSWRIIDARDSARVLAVISPPADPDGKNAWIEFLVELGAAS